MTLEQIRVFIEVASQQHIRKAAERLNLTQSAVSASIKALEDRHECKLFDRVGRSIVINQTGKAFLIEAEKIVASVKAGEAILNDLSGFGSGEISIMASRTIGAYWLPSRLVDFRRRYPSISLHVQIGNSDDVTDAVRSGRADIGLIERPGGVSGIQYREVAKDEMVVIVGSDHPWATTQQPVSSLAEATWVLRERGSGTRTAFNELLADFGTSPNDIVVEMELPDNEAILGAVQSGLGATFISKHVAANALEHGSVVRANLRSMRRAYFLLRSEERYRSKASDAFEALISAID